MKVFKDPPCPRAQLSLMPASLEEAVASDAPVRRLASSVDQMDCSAVYASYPGGGAPAYNPRMLLKLLLLGYSEGIRSSRRIAERCTRDTHYMFIAEMSRPDFRTLCRFRRRNEAAIKALFRETVRLCQKAGLVLLQHVAVDGTRLEANVSSKETYSRERAERAIKYTDECIARILAEAESEDADDEQTAESADPPADGSTRDTPPKKDRNALVRRLRLRKQRANEAREVMEKESLNSVGANDLESRMMSTQAGNRPAYNAQAAVDSANHVIVAAGVTQENNDGSQFAPALEQVLANTGRKPHQASADCGYHTAEALAAAEREGVEAYISLGKHQKRTAQFEYDSETDTVRLPATEHSEEIVLVFHRVRIQRRKSYRIYRDRAGTNEIWLTADPSNELRRRAAMRDRMASSAGKAIYNLRKETVEPVFGHIKSVFGLRRLLLRGLSGASIEYLLACSAHNLQKLIGASPFART